MAAHLRVPDPEGTCPCEPGFQSRANCSVMLKGTSSCRSPLETLRPALSNSRYSAGSCHTSRRLKAKEDEFQRRVEQFDVVARGRQLHDVSRSSVQ
mmetsp:Transcript_50425/g.113570  ORF Transcript_50425/g.113570 Transcript_50425/m.113570 type:complete len:96 (+) Transcript_50425:1396-1683(+)